MGTSFVIDIDGNPVRPEDTIRLLSGIHKGKKAVVKRIGVRVSRNIPERTAIVVLDRRYKTHAFGILGKNIKLIEQHEDNKPPKQFIKKYKFKLEFYNKKSSKEIPVAIVRTDKNNLEIFRGVQENRLRLDQELSEWNRVNVTFLNCDNTSERSIEIELGKDRSYYPFRTLDAANDDVIMEGVLFSNIVIRGITMHEQS